MRRIAIVAFAAASSSIALAGTSKTWIATPAEAADVGLASFSTHSALVAGISASIAGAPEAPGPNAVAQGRTRVAFIAQGGYHAAGDGGWAEYAWDATSTAPADGVYTILPPGLTPDKPGRYVLRIPPGGVHPEVGGAYCDQPFSATVSGHDDTAALNNLISYVSKSGAGAGNIVFSQKATGCLINSDNLVVRPNVQLIGVGMPFFKNWNVQQAVPALYVNPSYTILMRSSSALRNIVIWRAGLAPYATNGEQIANYQNNTITDSSIAVTLGNAVVNDIILDDVVAVGFNKCYYSNMASRIHLHRNGGDCANLLEITKMYDVGDVDDLHANQIYTGYLGGKLTVYAATLQSGGSGYTNGDMLTIQGGKYTTPATLQAKVSGGGIITRYTVLDTGDYTVSPQTWGAGSASVAAGGAGGTNGTNVALTVQGGSCATQPLLLGAVSGGALTAITGVRSPGACPLTGQPAPVAAVSGGGLSGARVNVVMVKNALELAGGTGSGATATVSTQGACYRPGIGLYVHDQADGLVVHNSEVECFKTQAKIADVYDEKLFYIGGEGGPDTDRSTVGLELAGCVKDVIIVGTKSDGNNHNLLLNNHPNGGVAGACGYGSTTNPIIYGGQLAFNAGMTQDQILTGPGSTGTIIGLQLYPTGAGWPAGIQIGANSGTWALDDIQWSTSAARSPYGTWISVAPSADPPTSDQYAWKARGSLLDNGDMLVDQVNEGASGGGNPRIDRWRWTNNATGATTISQRITSGPTSYSGYEQLTVATSAKPPANANSYIAQNVEGPTVAALGWGSPSMALPVVIDWCAKASAAGTYSLFLKGSGEGSYVHPFILTSTNRTECFATVVPGPPIRAFATAIGSIGLAVGFDAGSGSTYQTRDTDTWQSAIHYEAVGATQLIATKAATLSIGAVHMRPGPFIAPYQPLDYATELQRAQRFFQKSFSAGTAVGQNKGAAGAVTMNTPFRSGSVSAPVRFGVGMITSPTVTFYNTNAADANCYDSTKSADVGVGSAVNVGTEGFTLSCSLNAGSPESSDQIQAQWSADSGY